MKNRQENIANQISMCFFGTYETEKERDVTKPTIKNPRGVDDNQNLLSDSLYSASAKGIHPINGFERECTLVKYGKKFHPVKKYAIDLADMTPSNRDKWLPSTRKWYLKIEYYGYFYTTCPD